MRMLVRDIDQFAPRLFVWVHTTAVHPQTMDASIDENTVAKFSNLSLEKVRALNSKATAAVHKSTTPHTIVDAFAATNTRPDGLYPGDIRHYRSEDLRYVFEHPVPEHGDSERTAGTWLLAYEATFHELGDVAGEDEED